MPPSKASSSWSALIENDFSWPRMSVNQRRMKRMPRSCDERLDVVGGLRVGRPSGRQARWTVRAGDGWTRGPGQSNQRSAQAFSSASAGASSRPFGRSARTQTLHRASSRRRGGRRCLAPRAPSSARTAAGRDRSGTACAISVKRSGPRLQQDVEDRAGPALADQLDRLVEAGAALRRVSGRSTVAAAACVAARRLAMVYAARSTRVSSTEPSTGISPATLTIAVKDSRASTAIASSSCSSLQPASRASSWRCWGTAPRSVSSGCR